MLHIRTGDTGGTPGGEGKWQELSIGLVNSERLLKHPSRDYKKKISTYRSVALKGCCE